MDEIPPVQPLDYASKGMARTRQKVKYSPGAKTFVAIAVTTFIGIGLLVIWLLYVIITYKESGR
jgi:hypothetical protein